MDGATARMAFSALRRRQTRGPKIAERLKSMAKMGRSMFKSFTAAASLTILLVSQAVAQSDKPPLSPQPLSPQALCDKDSLVCATMKDGRSVATSECKARADGAVKVLFGDCYNED